MQTQQVREQLWRAKQDVSEQRSAASDAAGALVLPVSYERGTPVQLFLMSEVPLYSESSRLVLLGAPSEDTAYRVTSLTRNSAPLGPYSSPMPRALLWS